MLTRAGFELAPSGYRFAALPFELSSPEELEASYPVCPVDISYMEELKGTEKGKMLFEKDLEVSFFSISCVEGTNKNSTSNFKKTRSAFTLKSLNEILYCYKCFDGLACMSRNFRGFITAYRSDISSV